MYKQTSIFLLFILFGCIGMKAQQPIYKNPSTPLEQRIENLLSLMTVEEKIAQMDLWAMWDKENKGLQTEVEMYGLGGFLGEITAEDANKFSKLASKQRLGIQLLLQIDACHGNTLYDGSTVFPTNISMAATFNKELAYNTARMAAYEIRGWGHRATYTPTMDIVQDPRFGRTGETFGECPFLSSVMASTYTRGYQDDLNKTGVVCCPKHFVGGGASIGGCNHASADISDRTLRQVFLRPFKAAVDAGALMIMAGHNDINGIPAHASHELLTKILKDEWGFKGFVVSDMGDVRNLKGKLHNVATTHEDALVMGINAGVDMYMNSENIDEFFRPMVKLVNEGRIPMSRIDDAVRRILRVKFMVGAFEDKGLNAKTMAKTQGTEASKQVALEGARECITLVKNDKQLLPLSTSKYKKIFLTGPNADDQSIIGDWASAQKQTITIRQGIEAIAGKESVIDYYNCGVIRGKPLEITKEMAETADPRILDQKIKNNNAEISDWSIKEAVKRALRNDITVVAVGGNAIRANWGLRTYGESCDMPSIGLYGKQLDLVKALQATGKPVVVVLVSGKVVSEPFINDSIPAIVYAWEPGQAGGQAVAEVLFGKYNPSGKLPITIPKSIGHIPQYYYQRESRFWTGYSYAGGKNEPAFPFGFGLSYTKYTYSNLVVPTTVASTDKEISVSVDVTNSGNMDGNETVMLFTRDVVASIAPYVKMLKGFEKVHLKVGETKTVTIKVPVSELGFWNADMKFVVEPGEFKVMIDKLSASFIVE
jgi:beta-glucosidase